MAKQIEIGVDDGSGNPIYGNWAVFVNGSLIDWEIGTTEPLPIDIGISSYNLINLFPGYNNFKLRVNTTILNGNNLPFGKIIGNSLINGETPMSNDFMLQFEFDNLNDFAPGYYQSELLFDLYGRNSSGNYVLLDSRFNWVEFNITGNQNTIIKTEKSVYTIVFNRTDNLLGGETLVNILNNSSPENLKFTNSGNVLESKENINDNFTISDNLSNLITNNQSLPAEGTVTIEAYLSKWISATSVWQKIYTFQIKLIIVNDNIVLTPPNAELSVIRSQNVTKQFTMTIANPFNKDFTISKPNWLMLSQNSGNATTDIVVTTIPSGQLTIGSLVGNIIVSYDNKEKVLPVKITVIDFVLSTIIEDFNFCLDKKSLFVQKRMDEGKYIQANINVKMVCGTRTENISLPITIPYFQNKCEIKIGEKVQAHFIKNADNILKSDISLTAANNKFLFKPAEITGVIKELDADYNEVYTENITPFKLYPGKKPIGFPLLSNHLQRSRREGSLYIFSYVNTAISVNNFLDAVLPPTYFDADSVEVVKIDDLENKIFFPTKKTIPILSKKLEIITLPKGASIINAQFLNSNLSLEWATFSGEFKITYEFTHKYSQNVINNLKEKFSTENIKTLSFNTGYILKSELAILKEIINSKICFFKIDSKFYKGFSLQQKLPGIDSTQELLQTDLEFLVTEYGN